MHFILISNKNGIKITETILIKLITTRAHGPHCSLEKRFLEFIKLLQYFNLYMEFVTVISVMS